MFSSNNGGWGDCSVGAGGGGGGGGAGVLRSWKDGDAFVASVVSIVVTVTGGGAGEKIRLPLMSVMMLLPPGVSGVIGVSGSLALSGSSPWFIRISRTSVSFSDLTCCLRLEEGAAVTRVGFMPFLCCGCSMISSFILTVQSCLVASSYSGGGGRFCGFISN